MGQGNWCGNIFQLYIRMSEMTQKNFYNFMHDKAGGNPVKMVFTYILKCSNNFQPCNTCITMNFTCDAFSIIN